MLESGARATNRFHGQMLALYVKQDQLTREAEETIHGTLRLARKLDAEVHVLEGRDPIATILRFAREQHIAQLFIGHTQRRAWTFARASPRGSIDS